MFTDSYYRNHEFLKEWFNERGITLMAMEPPPSRTPKKTRKQALKLMKVYYAHSSTTSDARSVVDLLDAKHRDRINGLLSMPRRAIDSVWYPFVQHNLIRSTEDIVTIDSAHNDVFTATITPPAKRHKNYQILAPKFDGSASWWTQGVGHSNHKLTAAASYAAGRYGHVIFPQAIHEPALNLAERLLKTQGKGWASRAFFSDNGSTGMEVALKMALRYTAMLYPSSGPKPQLEILGLSGSYHGDTLGAMDASEGGAYNSTVEWYKGRGLWLDAPTLGFEDGQLRVRVPWNGEVQDLESLSVAYNVQKRLEDDRLRRMYRLHITQIINEAVSAGRQFGALVMEPLVLGAGGMRFIDPVFQYTFVEVTRSLSHVILPPANGLNSVQNLPVIFDEVFTGLGRLGWSSPSSILGIKPDAAVYAKLLTGGLIPMAITLASKRIFSAFLGDEKSAALLHGHSYTAYPVGCAVANTSLDLLTEALKGQPFREARRKWINFRQEVYQWMDVPPETTPSSLWNPGFVEALSKSPDIERVMTLGTVLGFEVKSGASGAHDFFEYFPRFSHRPLMAGYGSSAAELALAPLKGDDGIPLNEMSSVHFRTLGNVGYLITSLTTEKQHIRLIEERVLQCFRCKSKGP
jgi:dethiobiotin synthetase/adenosylmethionine--8-amino-7-oxononanoate aminotransferase